MTSKKAYEEALRRIREAEETGARALDLSGVKQEKTGAGLKTLTRLPPELERLTSLQSLNLSWCRRISDLPPLASLTSLQSLSLSGCDNLSDIGPLAGLTSLRSLDWWNWALVRATARAIRVRQPHTFEGAAHDEADGSI